MKPIKISEAEWEVMAILWKRAPVSCRDVVEEVAERKGWHNRTIRTLLDRLISKGAVTIQTKRRPYTYESLVSREECVQSESRSFMERVFEGEPASMLLHLVKYNKLKPEDIRQLKKILNEKGK